MAPSGPPFTAETTLTEADIDAYSKWSAARVTRIAPRPGMIPYTTAAFIVALAATLAAVFLGVVPPRRGGPVAALLLLAFFAGVYTNVAIARRHYRKAARLTRDHARYLERSHRWELNEAGLYSSDDDAQGAYRWHAIDEVVETAGLLIFRTSPSQGTIIPLRAFPTPEAATAAKAYATTQIKRPAP